MLLRRGEAARDFLVRVQADRDATAVIAVVRLGDHRVADAPRCALRLALALHQFLARHRQAERSEDLVGFFLVARELDRDVRGPSGHGRLDALLVLAVAELHQRLVVQAQPRNAAGLGRLYQRAGRGTERAALGEADELIARRVPAPVPRHAAGRAQLGRQERGEQSDAEFACLDALVALGVLVDDRVDARPVGAASLAEGDFFAGDVLQFDRDVLEHVAQPGALVLAHAADEAAGFAIGTTVLAQAGQRLGEVLDESVAEPRGRPLLEFAEVELETNDREMRVQRRSDVDRSVENPHRRAPGC